MSAVNGLDMHWALHLVDLDLKHDRELLATLEAIEPPISTVITDAARARIAEKEQRVERFRAAATAACADEIQAHLESERARA